MRKYLADAKTILVLDGRPYRLVREVMMITNDTCKMCDLKKRCNAGCGAMNLLPLCTIGRKNGAWFFKEDHNCVNHPILAYVQPDAKDEIIDL